MPKEKYLTRNGMVMRVGGRLYKWWVKNKNRLNGIKPKPKVHPLRSEVVKWAKWGAYHEPNIHYTEGSERGTWLHGPVGHLPINTDCSGFATLCYAWAGAQDPNGFNFGYLGYTGTLLDHAAKVGKVFTVPADGDASAAKPGDLIVMGPGTGEHVVVCVESGKDPLVVSHGDEAGPVLQHLSVDGRTPKRILSYL